MLVLRGKRTERHWQDVREEGGHHTLFLLLEVREEFHNGAREEKIKMDEEIIVKNIFSNSWRQKKCRRLDLIEKCQIKYLMKNFQFGMPKHRNRLKFERLFLLYILPIRHLHHIKSRRHRQSLTPLLRPLQDLKFKMPCCS